MMLTKENRKSLPALYSTRKIEDPIAQVKFFTPWSSWTWYITEFDGEDTMFGLVVNGDERELGYVSFSELISVVGPYGLKVERDRWFSPTPLSKCR